jgi:ornithine cyclodeaminase/alanine dehydrogenase-like protein (mu-crystallin family)
MNPFPFIDGRFISQNTAFAALAEILKNAFAQNEMIVPLRHHHDFPNPGYDKDSTMLLMPAWNPGKSAGVKIVAVSPHNSDKNLPTIQGTYLYLDSKTGSIKAILEAKTLTNKRTAAASALASTFLSNKNADSLLVIGTGSLAPDLVRAHCAVRPIQQIWIYGRTSEKADTIAKDLSEEGYNISVAGDLQYAVFNADIISCATISETPLFRENGYNRVNISIWWDPTNPICGRRIMIPSTERAFSLIIMKEA